MTNSLTTDKYNSISEQLDPDNNVKILNPLSTDLSIMRQSLIFSGLETDLSILFIANIIGTPAA